MIRERHILIQDYIPTINLEEDLKNIKNMSSNAVAQYKAEVLK